MSSLYSLAFADTLPLKMYGFQKVNQDDMEQIVKRVSRGTYSSNFAHGERNRTKPCPPRPPSSHCHKAPPLGSECGYGTFKRYATDRELDRIVRRLRTPTVSLLAATDMLREEYQEKVRHDVPLEDKIGGKYTLQERSVPEKVKAMKLLRRPTTATRSKSAASCAICDDPDIDFDLDFSGDKAPNQDDLEDIIDRVRAPTVASEGGHKLCRRPHTCPGRRSLTSSARRRPPLVSGLPRSSGVDEIVARLYTPTTSIPICRAKSAPARRNTPQSKTQGL